MAARLDRQAGSLQSWSSLRVDLHGCGLARASRVLTQTLVADQLMRASVVYNSDREHEKANTTCLNQQYVGWQ
eukprot:1920034-Alexandrium_andersonii.AAC.1